MKAESSLIIPFPHFPPLPGQHPIKFVLLRQHASPCCASLLLAPCWIMNPKRIRAKVYILFPDTATKATQCGSNRALHSAFISFSLIPLETSRAQSEAIGLYLGMHS